MDARHDFPPIHAARVALLDHQVLVAGLALIAVRSPTGRAQARVEQSDRLDGLAALVLGVRRAPVSFGPAPDDEHAVHPDPSTRRQPFALQNPVVTTPPDPVGQRERS